MKGGAVSGKETKCKCEKALERAEQVRQFEIELYWKRSAYFWTFIALAFAGYGAIQVHGPRNLKGLDFLLANVGFVASVAWFLVNRGSKYWQEQWETKVDKFEDCVTGPLYKLIITRCNEKSSRWQRLAQWATGPRKYSASRLNQMGSLYVSIVWIFLGVRSLLKPECCDKLAVKFTERIPPKLVPLISEIDCFSPAFLLLTLVTVFGAFRSWGKTKPSDYCYTEKTRGAYLLFRLGHDSGDYCQKTPVRKA